MNSHDYGQYHNEFIDGTTNYKTDWETYTGFYEVPSDTSGKTRFTFTSLAAPSWVSGNHIDDVQFTVSYPLTYHLNNNSTDETGLPETKVVKADGLIVSCSNYYFANEKVSVASPGSGATYHGESNRSYKLIGWTTTGDKKLVTTSSEKNAISYYALGSQYTMVEPSGSYSDASNFNNLYGLWEQLPTVTWKDENGKVIKTITCTDLGEVVSDPTYTPTSGTFSGWKVVSGASTYNKTGGVTSDTIIQAQVTHKVVCKFASYGSKNTASEYTTVYSADVSEGANVTVPAISSTKASITTSTTAWAYYATGWTKSSSSSDIYVTDDFTSSSATVNAFIMPASDVYLYASENRDGITITKTGNSIAGSVPYADTSQVTWSFNVTNIGDGNLSNINFTDDLLTKYDVSLSPISTLAKGETKTFTAEMTLKQADINAGKVTNTVTASAKSVATGNTVSSISNTATIDIPQVSQLSISKDANVSSVDVNGDVVFTIKVTNTGNTVLKNIKLTDTDSHLALTNYALISSLVPGQCESVTKTVTATEADAIAKTISGSASASATDPNGAATNSPVVSNSVNVLSNSSLSITKTAKEQNLASPEPGDEITWLFYVENTGDITVNDIIIEDPLLKSKEIAIPEIGTLIPGAYMTVEAAQQITQEDIDNGSVKNSATAKGTSAAGVLLESNESQYEVGLEHSSLVEIAKTAEPAIMTEARVGDIVTFNFNIVNSGNTTLTKVNVVDEMDNLKIDVSWPGDEGILLPGEKVTASAKYTVAQADLDNGKLTNVAHVEAMINDEQIESEDSTVTVPIKPYVELRDSNTASDLITATGDNMPYILIVVISIALSFLIFHRKKA